MTKSIFHFHTRTNMLTGEIMTNSYNYIYKRIQVQLSAKENCWCVIHFFFFWASYIILHIHNFQIQYKDEIAFYIAFNSMQCSISSEELRQEVVIGDALWFTYQFCSSSSSFFKIIYIMHGRIIKWTQYI